MDIAKEISQLQDKIKQLRELRDLACHISDTACQIEAEISAIDESLPNPKNLSEIKDRSERAQLSRAERLLQEAYSIIDKILGPPEDELAGQLSDTAYSPEARGYRGLSLDEMLKGFPIGKKGNAS